MLPPVILINEKDVGSFKAVHSIKMESQFEVEGFTKSICNVFIVFYGMIELFSRRRYND